MAGKICGRVQNAESRMMPIRAYPKQKISDEHFMLRNNNRSILFSSSLLYLAARCKIDVGPQSTMPFFSSSSHSTSETFWDQVHTCVIGHARVQLFQSCYVFLMNDIAMKFIKLFGIKTKGKDTFVKVRNYKYSQRGKKESEKKR